MTRFLVVALSVVWLGGCGGGSLFASKDAAEARFQRVYWSLGGGPCTEEMDCSGFYELRADGTLRVDRFGESGSGVHETTLPAEELEAAVKLATDSDFLKLLRRGPTPCGMVTDSSSQFTVELEGERLQAQLAGCSEPSVEALRKALLRLDETYLKSEGSTEVHFQRVQWTLNGGPCTEQMDCRGFYELRADGTFRVDRFGEYGGGVHETTLPAGEVEATVKLATDAALLGLLRRGPTPCQPVTDFSSEFTLELEGEWLHAQVVGCNEPSAETLRRALLRLEDTYLK